MLRANTKFFCSDRDEPEILAIVLGNWALRIDRFVGAGSPTIIAPKQTISKTRPHPTNKPNVRSDLRWGWGGFI